MATGTRWAMVVLAIAVAVVAFAIAKSGGDSDTTTTGTRSSPALRVVHIDVRGGKPVGGIRDITVKQGQRVRFTVASDVADEIHVHGYDFHKDVRKNGSVGFNFPAKISGAFVVELESRGEQIADLKVRP
jgi:hypothetical protein